MCKAISYQTNGNSICIYCGSVNHSSGRCRNKPNGNREEPRSTLRDLREQGPRMNYNRMGHQPQVSHHQARINEGLNRQYSPNYINPYQSTLGSAPGQDLSTTLIELANIQLRSMEMMAASQRSQQEVFQELARVSKDKSNDSMLQPSKPSTVQIGRPSKIGSTKSTRLAEQVIEDSGQNYLRSQLEP